MQSSTRYPAFLRAGRPHPLQSVVRTTFAGCCCGVVDRLSSGPVWGLRNAATPKRDKRKGMGDSSTQPNRVI